jgi:ABC-2 type transport system permease protein
MMPTIMLLVLPWAATFEQKDIRLCIVDNDRSAVSAKLIHKLSSSGYFNLVLFPDSYDKALSFIEKGQSDLILEIPQNFEKSIFRERRVDYMLNIDAVNGQKAGIALSYITQSLNGYLQEIAPAQMRETPKIVLKPQYRYNASMEYFPFMVPGIFVILVTVMTGVMAALNIVREKEIGTIEQINVTPIGKFSFILGKVIPFWIMGIIILSIGILIARLMYGIVPEGNLLNIYLAAFIYIVSYTGLGVIISNIADTQQQSMLIMFFTLMILILLGGLFTPINSMPNWAQAVTLFNPFRYFVEIVRLVYLKGSGFMDILPQILKLIAFSVVLNTVAVISYRKTNR